MLFELKLGTLIRKLNPYTNGEPRTMRCGTYPPVVSPGLAAALTAAAQAIQAYADAQTAADQGTALQAAEQAELNADQAMDNFDIDLVIDNDNKQEYMNWTFRGQPHAVKRALRIRYRYELMDNDDQPTGIYVIEHVLIGYAGGNG